MRNFDLQGWSGIANANTPQAGFAEPAIDPNPDFNTKKLAGKAAELAKRAAALMNKTATVPAAAAPVAKVAGSSVDNLINPRDPQFHFKLASFVLENEEVLAGVQEAMERKLGADEALGAIKNAYVAHAQFIEAAGQQDQWEKQAAYENAMIKQAFDQLSPADQKQAIKFANAHEAARNGLNPELNDAYNQGILDADFILNRTTKSAAGMPPEAGAPPEAAGPEEIPAEEFPGAAEPEAQASPEEIIAVLEQLVQEGKIPMKEAQQVAEAIMAGAGGGEGGGPEGGMPPMDAGADAGGPPPTEGGAEEAMEPEGEEIAKKAAALLGIKR